MFMKESSYVKKHNVYIDTRFCYDEIISHTQTHWLKGGSLTNHNVSLLVLRATLSPTVTDFTAVPSIQLLDSETIPILLQNA